MAVCLVIKLYDHSPFLLASVYCNFELSHLGFIVPLTRFDRFFEEKMSLN